MTETGLAVVETAVCRRVLKLFVRRGPLDAEEAQAMRQWGKSGGFSVDPTAPEPMPDFDMHQTH